MRLKSFHGPTLTDAMKQVRTALGDDAIIVSTRDEETGGVRVTAAIDDSAPKAAKTSMPAKPPEPDAGSVALENIAEALTRHAVPHALAEKLMATATQFATDDPLVGLAAAMDVHFRFAPLVDEKSDKPLMLIGPPGTGKTLCIAKLATKATMAKKPVTVISTDLERAGGMEQLAAFTRLLKLNLIEVEDAHALRDIIATQKGSQIFIDTAGCNPFNETERRATAAMVSAVGGEAVLALPAGLEPMDAIDMAEQFKSIGTSRLLLTRVEMVRRCGGLLRLAEAAQLPFAGFTDSSKVIDAPQPFNPVALARLFLPKAAAAKQAAKQSAV